MGRLLVTLKRSAAGRPSRQLETVKGLGLRRLGSARLLENTPAVRGMVAKVLHLVDVRELE
jgi:large subunit ribosomal protein L30